MGQPKGIIVSNHEEKVRGISGVFLIHRSVFNHMFHNLPCIFEDAIATISSKEDAAVVDKHLMVLAMTRLLKDKENHLTFGC